MMKPLKRVRIVMILTFIIALTGYIWSVHDTPLLLAAAGGAGLVWATRRAGIFIGVVLAVVVALFWSSLDATGCSVFWRGKMIYAQLAGDLPYVPWKDARRAAFSSCYGLQNPDPVVAEKVFKLAEKIVNGRQQELYRTDLGDFWITAPGNPLLTFLVWEITAQNVYQNSEVRILPGDTVIDCGAHVGVFTRYALSRGAKRVVAIEPEPGNIACLEANFSKEIAAGDVILVKAGVWDRRSTLRLTLSRDHSGANRFESHHGDHAEASFVEDVPVLPLDDLVQEIRLDRVDFIKMDQ